MYGRHEAFDDLEVVVDHLGERCQAVGSAGGIGNNLEAWIVSFQVHTDDEHRRVSRGSGDDDFLGAALQVSLQTHQRTLNLDLTKDPSGIWYESCFDFTYRCFLDGREHAGRLDDVLGASLRPWDRLWFALAEDGDLVSVYDETVVLGFDLSLEFTVGGVILEHVDHVIETDEGVIDGDDLLGRDLGLVKRV